MKSKLVSSIAIAMVTVVALSMLAVLPVRAQEPVIYMTPNTFNGATIGLGNTFQATMWVSGYGTPPVFAFQVDLMISNMAAGVIVTAAALPAASDSQYLLFGQPTARPTPSIAPDGSYVKVGDTSLGTSVVPGPNPAKLAVITLKVVAAPAKFQTLTTALNINNVDTYLLDDSLAEIPAIKTDGTYSWAWSPPTTQPNVAVHFINPDGSDVIITTSGNDKIEFDQFIVWNGTNFVAQVWIDNLDVGWAISGASFTLNYDLNIISLVSATLDPAFTGTVDTTTPGVIIVSATPSGTMSGSFPVLSATFELQNQGVYPGDALSQTANLVLTGVNLEDTVGPIPVNAIENGVVQLDAKVTLAFPYLTVTPPTIYSGTDLVIGNQFGKTFTVQVNINNLAVQWHLVAIQFRLQYDSSLVQLVSVSEGPFLAPFDNGQGTFFVAVNTLHDPLYGDNVAVGDMLLPNTDGVWTVFPFGSGVVATFTFAYVGQDFVNTYNMPLNLVDFSLPPGEQVYFIDNTGATIQYDALNQAGGMVIIQPISTIGRRIDVWMQYPAPYGGQGLNQPADLVVPQQIIILTAKVTYNWWPVVNKKVTFNIYDNEGNLVAVLEAITGADGHAVTSYRMPWPLDNPEGLFGVWTVVASVSVADVTVTDTLTFHYDYLVEILNATVDKVNYNHLDYMAVTVTYGSHAQQMYPVFLTATLQDNLLVPVSVAFTGLSVSGATFCTLKVYPTATLTLFVPYYAYAGAATVRVDFLDKSPMDGTHTAVTPEDTISGIYILPV